MGPMRVLSDFLLMQETEGEMQESELARWARRQRSRIQWGLKDGEEWSGREDLNLRPPGPEPGALPDCATPRTLLPRATHDAKRHAPRCEVPEAAAAWMPVCGMQSVGREAHWTAVPA